MNINKQSLKKKKKKKKKPLPATLKQNRAQSRLLYLFSVSGDHVMILGNQIPYNSNPLHQHDGNTSPWPLKKKPQNGILSMVGFRSIYLKNIRSKNELKLVWACSSTCLLQYDNFLQHNRNSLLVLHKIIGFTVCLT